MKKRLPVFVRSVFLTVLSLALVFLLATGFIVVDNNYSTTLGNQPGSYLDLDENKEIITVSLFGNEYQIDTSFINQTTSKIEEIKPIIPPEVRLVFESVKGLFKKIEEGVEGWIS